ncbi:E3 ubiquitin-protein ligase RAD18 [Halictus rubicundus]|uniref:E3 ubiquitin-protein ligase RAD18 n=1 Tax=Halictus rubicundus TaxID=77578 RepID=UPI0040356B1D
MWPPEYIQLKHIEDLMFCGICYEYINTSVITSCSHNYCSLCIRKYLHYKTQCPTCFAETFEKDLRKNKVLDEIIAQFLQVKDKLKKCLKGPLQFLPGNKCDGFLNSPKSTHQKKYSPSIKQENASISRNLISANIASPSTNVQRDLSSPSTSGKNKIPEMFTPKSTKRQDPVSTDETKVVICPVCKVTISETNINRHLDDCLKREAKKDQVQIKTDAKRQPLPKLVFSLMKDAVMRKKLKEFGLSAQGERKIMEARLQRYIVLYNAECDKSTPRSVSELIKQCEDEENLEKRINKTSFINKLQVNRNTEQNVIDEERKKYLEAHKDSFESLIKRIKSSELQRNPTVRRNLLNESFEGYKRTVQKSETIAESSDDSINDVDKNDLPSVNSHAYIQDSDSDSACPLQMYSSSDPKKCLNIEFPCNNNAEMNETRSDYNDHVGEIEVESDHVKSDIRSDISVCTWNSSNHKISLKRGERMKFSKDETRRVDFSSTRDNSSSDQEDGDCEKPAPVLQNICYDLSSNDSIDSKLSSGKSNAVNNGFLNNSLLNSSRIEKENISSSPECSGSRSYRKRNRDFIQNDGKTVYDVKKRLKKLSPSNLSETDESNEGSVSVLCDDQETCLQSKTRLRNRNMNTTVVESTTVLRKSVRTKRKNNM